MIDGLKFDDRGLVPVVVQDPTWEASFPPIGGVPASFSSVSGDRLLPIRLTAAEAAERRAENEDRRAMLLDGFAALGLDHVEVSTDDPVGIHTAFLRWAEDRLIHGGRLG